MAEYIVNDTDQQMDEKEQIQHVHAIDKLVHELKLPADIVNQSYREVLADLQKDARVKIFLPVLVSRSVKERLKQR